MIIINIIISLLFNKLVVQVVLNYPRLKRAYQCAYTSREKHYFQNAACYIKTRVTLKLEKLDMTLSQNQKPDTQAVTFLSRTSSKRREINNYRCNYRCKNIWDFTLGISVEFKDRIKHIIIWYLYFTIQCSTREEVPVTLTDLFILSFPNCP